MEPEVSEVHELLNPLKDVESLLPVTDQQGSDQEQDEKAKLLPIIEANNIKKHKKDNDPGTSWVCKECGKDFSWKGNRHKLFSSHVRRCEVSKFNCDCPDVEEIKPDLSKEDAFKSYKKKAQHIQVKCLCVFRKNIKKYCTGCSQGSFWLL